MGGWVFQKFWRRVSTLPSIPCGGVSQFPHPTPLPTETLEWEGGG